MCTVLPSCAFLYFDEVRLVEEEESESEGAKRASTSPASPGGKWLAHNCKLIVSQSCNNGNILLAAASPKICVSMQARLDVLYNVNGYGSKVDAHSCALHLLH